MNAPTGKITAAPCVYTAINAVMAHMAKEGIGKDRKNTQQGYKFRGIDDVYNTLCGVMAENKLMMLPFVQDMKREQHQTKGGSVLNYTILTVDFKLVSSEDGSSDIVRMIGEAMDTVDKSSNKAQSAALKYAALEVFMIPTEGDNDADATTHDVAASSAEPAADTKWKEDRNRGKIPDAEWAKLVQLVEATKADRAGMAKHFNVRNLGELSPSQYDEAIDMLERKLAKAAKAESNQRGGDWTNSGPPRGEFADVAEGDVPF